jgi:RecA/RadA recombinase
MSNTILEKALKSLKKINPDTEFLNNNTLSNITGYVNTGSYALNAIISGNIKTGGVPIGRITGLSGPSGCGKTLMVNKIFANAQKQYGMIPVMWDTEAAVDLKSAASVGCNVDEYIWNPVDKIEDCRNQMVQFLDNIIANPEMKGKFILGLDSLGNLVAAKELQDIEKNKDAADMGLRARAMKSLMRTLTLKAAKAQTPIVFTNHIYDDPSSLFPSLIKNQGGGKGPVYLASVLVQMSMTQNKEDDVAGDKIAIANKVNGITMSAMTVKNRIIPPFLRTELLLNFKTGLDEYSGLDTMVKAYDVVVQTGSTYQLPDGTKLGYYSKWGKDKDLWENILIPELQKKLDKELTYSNDQNLIDEDDQHDEEET